MINLANLLQNQSQKIDDEKEQIPLALTSSFPTGKSSVDNLQIIGRM